MRNGNWRNIASSTGISHASLILGCRPPHLPLRHLIDRVDVVHALHCIQIALVHRVDSQVTGTALRVRPPPLADAHRYRPGLLVMDPLLAISPSFAQVVD